KFRAARRIWAREMRETFGAKDPRSWWMRFHTQTAGVSLMAQQPEVNLLRTTLQALAAVLGGTQSLHTNSMDEAIALPSEHAATLALRTQQVIAHQPGAAHTLDPLAATHCLEAACREITHVMPPLLDAVRAHATLGETCDVMRNVFGGYLEPVMI